LGEGLGSAEHEREQSEESGVHWKIRPAYTQSDRSLPLREEQAGSFVSEGAEAHQFQCLVTEAFFALMLGLETTSG
jgi:hypothetical protein